VSIAESPAVATQPVPIVASVWTDPEIAVTGERTAAERLLELDRIRDLLTDAEYQKKRDDILSLL